MAVLDTKITEILTELCDSVDFEETGDITKARRVITLVNQLLILRPTSASHSASSASFDPKYIADLGNRARAFVNANADRDGPNGSGAGCVVFISPSRRWRGVAR